MKRGKYWLKEGGRGKETDSFVVGEDMVEGLSRMKDKVYSVEYVVLGLLLQWKVD